MSRWSPHRLPRMRRDQVQSLRSATADAHLEVADADRIVNNLLAADLYWVTADMAQVAMDAAGSLPEWTPSEAMPSRRGMLVWDRPIARVPWPGAPARGHTRTPLGAPRAPEVAVWGVTWWPDPDRPERPQISVLTRSVELGDLLTDRWARSDMFMFSAISVPHDDVIPGGDYVGDGAPVIRTLASTWLMMQQPTVASRTSLDEHDADGSGGMARPDRDVTIIDLRRLREPDPDREGVEPGTGGRVYTRRWLVGGHWRQQAVGPGRSLRRPTWIPPYVKGPDGAPLIETERVNVWRR